MRIHFLELERLKGQPKELNFSFSAPEIAEQNPQIIELSPIHFVGEARYEAGLFRVNGEMTFTGILSCSRCLTQTSVSFQVPFDEYFSYERARPQVESDTNPDIHWVDGDSVELLPYCKEAIILAVPYVPLCNPDCIGLCPDCGKNLNEGECGCTVEHIDPRLADLAKFFNQNES